MLSIVVPAYNEGEHIYDNLMIIDEALKSFTGAVNSKGDIVGFIDADLDLSPKFLGTYYATMTAENADIVLGSKMHKDSKLEYPFARKVFSFCYYIMLKVLFGLKCHDTQTGIKLYKGSLIREIAPLRKIDGYAFDIELLALASKKKAKLLEMPVELNFTRGESFGRIKFKDVWKMFTDTWKIWWNLRIKKSYFK